MRDDSRFIWNSFTSICLLASVIAIGLAGAVAWQGFNTPTQYAVVDAQSVIEAKKLVLLSRLRQREHDVELIAKTVEESEKIGAQMQEALVRLAQKYKVTILDKKALLYGKDVMDLTDVLYAEMGTSHLEGVKAKENIQKEIFKK